MSGYVRCPSCASDIEPAPKTHPTGPGEEGLYVCTNCGTEFQQPAEEVRTKRPAAARESVIRISEGTARRASGPQSERKVTEGALASGSGQAAASDPQSINLHSEVGWVYPPTAEKYHFEWEPPDLGQEPPSKWRRKWNETVNMFKYFRLVDTPLPPRAQEHRSTVHRPLEELKELRPTEPDAL